MNKRALDYIIRVTIVSSVHKSTDDFITVNCFTMTQFEPSVVYLLIYSDLIIVMDKLTSIHQTAQSSLGYKKSKTESYRENNVQKLMDDK